MIFLVSVVGGAGAATRFFLDEWARGRWSTRLPMATIAINVAGSLIVGILAGAMASQAIPATTSTVMATGFCGGFTTFSTSMVETVRLAQAAAYRRSAFTAIATLTTTVAAAALGVALGALLP